MEDLMERSEAGLVSSTRMSVTGAASDPVLNVLSTIFGYSSLRPLQGEAITAAIEGRDALVVMPTGGGKSICYQIPPLVKNDLTVVVSPLIALMKDQVDSLRAMGIAARQVDSTTSPAGKRAVADEALGGELRLLFVAPERLNMPRFQTFLRRARVARFAIDEAHCISHWGHDFRPDYRLMSELRDRFPDAVVHAFTATATQRVRKDIVEQLGLSDPEMLIGTFDRPNLVYRVVPRTSRLLQIIDVVKRHPGEGGIVYCIRRKDVDSITEGLKRRGIDAVGYHAGMTPEEREAAQNAFSREECDVVVATVAFGMGVDRSNIRYVVHAGMPKSIETYQQETGRAGRDGLEAECVLLHSYEDARTWEWILEKSWEEHQIDDAVRANALRQVREMNRFARGGVCRHRVLVQYFDQKYEKQHCGACDMCLGKTELVDEPVTIAKKILSAVARTGQRFGTTYVAAVLRGEKTRQIVQNDHDELSTWGLLSEHPVEEIRDWIYQLVDQDALELTMGEYPTLQLNEKSWRVMRDEETVVLRRVREMVVQKVAPDRQSRQVAPESRDLFDYLRDVRKAMADEKNVPAYVIFGDITLKEMAEKKPSSLDEMRLLYGVGDAKLKTVCPAFLEAIRSWEGQQSPKFEL